MLSFSLQAKCWVHSCAREILLGRARMPNYHNLRTSVNLYCTSVEWVSSFLNGHNPTSYSWSPQTICIMKTPRKLIWTTHTIFICLEQVERITVKCISPHIQPFLWKPCFQGIFVSMLLNRFFSSIAILATRKAVISSLAGFTRMTPMSPLLYILQGHGSNSVHLASKERKAHCMKSDRCNSAVVRPVPSFNSTGKS